MCRFAALVADAGAPPPPLAALLYDPPHSLERQAFAPREQQAHAVNVDGTGVAWWADDAPAALRYASDRPPWSDPNLPALAPRLRAGRQIAAVRWATPGIPYGADLTAPFTRERLAFAHNGWIGGFRTRTARPLLDRLPDHLYAAHTAASDSLAFFLTVVAAWERDRGAGLAGAVRAGVATVVRVCRDAGVAARLNLLAGDGERIVAVRTSLDEPCNSLHVLEHGERWPRSRLVASEPLDEDAAWTAVPAHHLAELTPDALTVTPL